MELRGIVESWILISFFAVFFDINVMNAEVFATGLEKCKLLTRLLGQNVENLDHYGCSKFQDLIKTDNSWICASYLFEAKQGFTVPRGKQRCTENGLWNICNFFTSLLYLCLLLN